jgi:hypothetical protein
VRTRAGVKIHLSSCTRRGKYAGLVLDGDVWSAVIPQEIAPRLGSTVGVDALEIRKFNFDSPVARHVS